SSASTVPKPSLSVDGTNVKLEKSKAYLDRPVRVQRRPLGRPDDAPISSSASETLRQPVRLQRGMAPEQVGAAVVPGLEHDQLSIWSFGGETLRLLVRDQRIPPAEDDEQRLLKRRRGFSQVEGAQPFDRLRLGEAAQVVADLGSTHQRERGATPARGTMAAAPRPPPPPPPHR